MVIVQCADGDAMTYPLASVELEVQGRTLMVEAAVSNALSQFVLPAGQMFLTFQSYKVRVR